MRKSLITGRVTSERGERRFKIKEKTGGENSVSYLSVRNRQKHDVFDKGMKYN